MIWWWYLNHNKIEPKHLTHSQSFIVACHSFSDIFIPRIVVSLLPSLVTNEVNDATQDTSTRTVRFHIEGFN